MICRDMQFVPRHNIHTSPHYSSESNDHCDTTKRLTFPDDLTGVPSFCPELSVNGIESETILNHKYKWERKEVGFQDFVGDF